MTSDSNWVAVKEQVLFPEYEKLASVRCTYCKKLAGGIDDARILFCGHIYHAECLSDVVGKADSFCCASCPQQHQHPGCGCDAVTFPVPWGMLQSDNVMPKTLLEGGALSKWCPWHTMKSVVRALAERIAAGEGLDLAQADDTAIVWVSTGKIACSKSKRGVCWEEGDIQEPLIYDELVPPRFVIEQAAADWTRARGKWTDMRVSAGGIPEFIVRYMPVRHNVPYDGCHSCGKRHQEAPDGCTITGPE